MNILENYLFFVGLQNQLMAISVDGETSHYEVYKFDSLEDEWVFIELLKLPEGNDIGKAINEGMVAIEADNSELNDILPKNYNQFDNRILVSLLKIFNSVQKELEGDAFGKIYEYFLGKFAMSEG